MDFSTKKVDKSVEDKEEVERPKELMVRSFTSSRELRFAKNLKLVLVEIFRNHPVKARMIIDYMRSVGRQMREPNLTPSGQSVNGLARTAAPADNSDGNRSTANNNNDGGKNSGTPGKKTNSSEGGGSGTGSGTGNGSGGNVNNNFGNNGALNNNNLDIDSLDFDTIQPETSHTAKWFAEHPDINPAKVFEGIHLKTEFPYPTDAKVEKPPDITSLDNATANLLQMSVPDPSTTFLDIGTDSSMYEDDPFKIENLLPSNFSINQLDTSPNNAEQVAALLSYHGNSENSVSFGPKQLPSASSSPPSTSTATPASSELPTPHQHLLHKMYPMGFPPIAAAQMPSAAAAIGRTLYPETTISLQQSHAAAAAAMVKQNGIKTEPLPYIKKEDLGPPPPPHHPPHAPHHGLPPHPPHNNNHHETEGPYDRTPGVSPMSSIGSMGSPGSPPHSYPGRMVPPLPSAAPPPPSIGGKMKPMGHPGGIPKRKPAPTTTPEEDELCNIPSLQMRIKILQQRVSTISLQINGTEKYSS